MSKPHFDGPDYEPDADHHRLSKQHDRVRETALHWPGGWFTLEEMSQKTGDPAASVSAQLRHLRKPRFGSYIVEKRRRGDRSAGLFEYRVKPPANSRAAEEAEGVPI